MYQKIDTLLNGIEKLNINLSEKQKKNFINYKLLLQEWNEKIDITTIIEDKEIDIKHFLDSLTLVESNLFEGEKKIIDIGTGGGFPGIPLKIYNKDLDITLMDSLNKRIIFLKNIIDSLELNNIEAIHGRAEELGRQEEYREKYDICVSRAVARLNILSEYCMPFVKKGGYFIAMKGPDFKEELEESKKAIDILGGTVIDLYNVEIPESDIEHSIIIIEKIKETSEKYPRGGGKPRKKPL